MRTVGGNYTLYAYDGYGRETEKLTYSSVDNHADKCYSVYDDVARTVKSTVRSVDLDNFSEETLKVSTSYYDEAGRLTGQTEGNNLQSRTYKYDFMSNLTSETDGNGNTVSYTYNCLGQMVSVEDAENNVTAYAYDLAGNLASVTSPGGRTESYEYDTLGRMVKRTDKLGKSELYMYDAAGNVLKKKDRTGSVTVNEYNSRSLLVSTETGGLTVTYAYDLFNNVTEMTDATGTTEYSYTFDNLPASVTYPDGRSMSYSYSPEDNEILKTDYSGEETVEKFTLSGAVSSVSDDDGTLAGYGFKGGLLTSSSFNNGSVTYSYDRAGRITALNNSAGGITRGYTYEYDSAGNQTKKTETGNGNDKVTEYAYDSLNRLSEVTESDGTRIEYGFDEWGNITEKAYYHPEGYVFESGDVSISGVTEHTVSYSYDEANRLLSETESVTGSGDFSGTHTYAYDDAGNLTSKTTSGDYGVKSESYVYNALGKLVKYLEDGEEKASYKYNGNGQRVEKTVDGVKTKYYWDGANIKNEGTANAVNVTNYFGANGVFARKSGSGINTLYKNGHGDTVLLTNGNTVVRDYDYDAYGKEKGISSEDLNHFRYSGEYFDSETGFIYLRNRYYDPGTGRFISEDPHWNVKNMISGDEDRELSTDVFKVESEAKENKKEDKTESNVLPLLEAIIQSGNLYPYALNNPERYVDPEGEEALALTAAALIVVGGLVTTVLLVELDEKVGDVLKSRKGSIKNAPKPPGTPGWDAIRDLTMHEILRRAKNGDKGFKTIWKLLVDGRFKK